MKKKNEEEEEDVIVSAKHKAKGMSREPEMIMKSENQVTNGHILLLINQVNFTRATTTEKP